MRRTWSAWCAAALACHAVATGGLVLLMLVREQPSDRAASPVSRTASRVSDAASPVSRTARELLDDETVLLHYALADERSVVWAVTRRAATSHLLPPRRAIETAARRAHDLMAVSHTRQRRREAQRAADELSAILIAPIVHRLPAAKRLVIAGDGALHLVPFAALRAGTTPLVHLFEIINLPSASTLTAPRRELSIRRPAPRLAAVLADPVLDRDDPRVIAQRRATTPVAARTTDVVRSSPGEDAERLGRLPFTRREAEAIRALTGSRDSLIALDFEANRDAVMGGALSHYRIVHFATHGLLDRRHPESSGLVLSQVDEHGRPRDGLLRLQDIHRLRLNADLVVLSACRTALGQEIHGEGLAGLVRGFMHAGAQRVIASLWDVRDEATAALMERLYAGMIQDRLPPAAALRQAQLWMAAQDRWRAPYYWAGFVLLGDWR